MLKTVAVLFNIFVYVQKNSVYLKYKSFVILKYLNIFDQFNASGPTLALTTMCLYLN